MCPPKGYIGVLPSGIVNVTLFGNTHRCFADVIKLRCDHIGLE